MMQRPVLTVEQVAELIHCEASTVLELARDGKLPGLKFGRGGWVFPAGALVQRLDEIALQEAADRRRGKPAPAGVLHEIKGAKRKGPPALPEVG